MSEGGVFALENMGGVEYNKPMEQNELDKLVWRPTNPHDRFCRLTAFHPLYAPDFLLSFGDETLTKYIALDQLQEAPTTHLSEELKEVIMDASLTTRLRDATGMSEVLMHLEHKSRPSRAVVVQLLMEVALSLHFRWLLSKRSESGNIVLPIPLMVVVYNGTENWEGEIRFQDLFPELPEELRPFVPQFRVFLINLRRFRYGNLPGRPETQAIAESLMRATDGTFIEQLPGVLQHVADAEMDGRMRLGLARSISSYCSWSAGATTEQIIRAITSVFKGQEGIKMAEVIQNSIIQEGIEIGEARARIADIQKLLKIRFDSVPDQIVNALAGRTDLVALDSLFELAAKCPSMAEFEAALQ